MYLDFIEFIYYYNRLCIYYADRCCINLDNWNIFQQHNWHNYAWFFCFHDDNESEAVEAHLHDIEIPRPKNHDIEIPRPKNRDIDIPRPKNHKIKIRGLKHHDIEKWRQISHDIVIPRHFFRGQKATTSRFQDWKTTTSRFQDQKATTSSSCGILTLMPPVRHPWIRPSKLSINYKNSKFCWTTINISLVDIIVRVYFLNNICMAILYKTMYSLEAATGCVQNYVLVPYFAKFTAKQLCRRLFPNQVTGFQITFKIDQLC